MTVQRLVDTQLQGTGKVLPDVVCRHYRFLSFSGYLIGKFKAGVVHVVRSMQAVVGRYANRFGDLIHIIYWVRRLYTYPMMIVASILKLYVGLCNVSMEGL